MLPSRLRAGKLRLFYLMSLILVLSHRESNARDVRNAIENYRGLVTSIAQDDKCKVLSPEERRTVDVYRDGLVAFIQANNAGFASSKAVIDSESRARARAASCDSAFVSVRNSYEDVVATQLSLKPALVTMAMNMGERCKVISRQDDNTLMQAWLRMGNDVVKRYNASIRARYVIREQVAEQEAERLPCSDAGQTIAAALRVAAQVLQQ